MSSAHIVVAHGCDVVWGFTGVVYVVVAQRMHNSIVLVKRKSPACWFVMSVSCTLRDGNTTDINAPSPRDDPGGSLPSTSEYSALCATVIAVGSAPPLISTHRHR